MTTNQPDIMKLTVKRFEYLVRLEEHHEMIINRVRKILAESQKHEYLDTEKCLSLFREIEEIERQMEQFDGGYEHEQKPGESEKGVRSSGEGGALDTNTELESQG